MGAAPKSPDKKRCEIKGGGQEMTAIIIFFNEESNAPLKMIGINIIAAIAWPPPLIPH